MENYPFIQTLLQTQLQRLYRKNEPINIIDVGAYYGVTASFFASSFPNTTVHVIEPSPICSEALGEVEKNNTNVKVYRLAIDGYDGTVQLYVQPEHPQGTTVITGFAKTTGLKKKVNCLTLKSFCNENNIEDIGLIMFNCEGSEYNIFMEESIKEIIPRMKVIDLILHGKSYLFMSEAYAIKRICINKLLLKNRFKLLYGEPVLDKELTKKTRVGHVRQVWLKSE